MRLFLMLLAVLATSLFATEKATTCKACHPIIYNEFQTSFHKKSSIHEDKIHKAIWDKHPAKAKGKYKCAKCHTPKNESHQGITCVTCHTIKDIKTHPMSNENIYETKPKTFYSAEKGNEDKKLIYKEKSSWFGLVKETTGSPYHDIDYRNKNFYTGEMCMGCHSHKQNGKKFNVCTTDIEGAKSKESNCITCHMPQVEGSSTTIRESKTHAFHGFAGVRNAPELLGKYVDISYKKVDNGFEIIIHNKAPHNLLTHPLRVVKLKTILKRDGKAEELKTHTFVKVIGTEGKPSMPWLATEVVKDNMIKGDEKRVIKFDRLVKSGDEVEVILGYHIVNPKAVKKIGLENKKELYQLITLKSSYFKVK
jgi:hypothetical protein